MDVAARMGMLHAPFSDNWSFPLVLGWDFAGTVSKVGKNVTGYKAGDRVFGCIHSDHAGNNCSYGSYIVTTPDTMAKIPAGLSFDQAAALLSTGGTAYEGIVENLKVKPNDTVLVQGGAGGVGLFAVQIAKAQGAKVIATASAPHNELLKQLGVDQVVDYHKQTVGDVVKDVDAVFDTAGDIAGGLTALKSGGKLVTVGGQPTPEQTNLPDKSVSFQSTHATTALWNVAALVTSGKVKFNCKLCHGQLIMWSTLKNKLKRIIWRVFGFTLRIIEWTGLKSLITVKDKGLNHNQGLFLCFDFLLIQSGYNSRDPHCSIGRTGINPGSIFTFALKTWLPVTACFRNSF